MADPGRHAADPGPSPSGSAAATDDAPPSTTDAVGPGAVVVPAVAGGRTLVRTAPGVPDARTRRTSRTSPGDRACPGWRWS